MLETLDSQAREYMHKAVVAFRKFSNGMGLQDIRYDGKGKEGFYMTFSVTPNDCVDDSYARRLSFMASKEVSGFPQDTIIRRWMRSGTVNVDVRPNNFEVQRSA